MLCNKSLLHTPGVPRVDPPLTAVSNESKQTHNIRVILTAGPQKSDTNKQHEHWHSSGAGIWDNATVFSLLQACGQAFEQAFGLAY